MIFQHTASEKGMWRGWLKNGQSLEITWPRASVGTRIGFHSGDYGSSRHLWIGLGFVQVFIPLGISKNDWPVGDEPRWGFDFSKEFGIWFRWGQRSKCYEWPFRTIVLSWDFETPEGWADVRARNTDSNGEWERRPGARRMTLPYRYRLRSGEVQTVDATIIQERFIRGRNILSKFGWPRRVEYSIDVEFSDEVGERAGSWKGGCIGCGYTMLPGETPPQTLRRMERERKFQ